MTYGRTVSATQLFDGLDHANAVARRMGQFFTEHEELFGAAIWYDY